MANTFLLSATMKIRLKKHLSIWFNSLVTSLFCFMLAASFGTLAKSSILLPKNIDELPYFDLMLMGGGIKTCSSLTPANCSVNTEFTDNARKEKRYLFTPIWLERALAHPNLNRLSERQKAQLRQASSHQILTSHSLNLPELESAIAPFNSQLLTELSDMEYYTLLDLLEEEQKLEDGTPFIEQVKLDATTNPYGPSLYRQLVQQALAKRRQNDPTATQPLIAIVTASARDPFEAAQFYVSALEQAGAEVVWLPLDAALQAGIATRQCNNLPEYREKIQGNTDRERLYPLEAKQQKDYCASPSKLYQKLKNIDGLFLNGGDQSLTLKAWLTPENQISEALKIVQQRLAQKKIIIAGTSAGTAVMTNINMITGGTSEGALSLGVFAAAPVSERCELTNCPATIPAAALTYRKEGGLGFFPFGITDTHFSQRKRQLRLLRLTALSENKMGFGVDENTALLVDIQQRKLSVTGEHGVWIIEQATDGVSEENHRYTHAISHYLTQGTTAEIDQNNPNLINILIDDSKVGISSATDTKDDFSNWIIQACQKNAFSIELGHHFSLAVTPTSSQSCQSIHQKGNSYQAISLTLINKSAPQTAR